MKHDAFAAVRPHSHKAREASLRPSARRLFVDHKDAEAKLGSDCLRDQDRQSQDESQDESQEEQPMLKEVKLPLRTEHRSELLCHKQMWTMGFDRGFGGLHGVLVCPKALATASVSATHTCKSANLREEKTAANAGPEQKSFTCSMRKARIDEGSPDRLGELQGTIWGSRCLFCVCSFCGWSAPLPAFVGHGDG